MCQVVDKLQTITQSHIGLSFNVIPAQQFADIALLVPADDGCCWTDGALDSTVIDFISAITYEQDQATLEHRVRICAGKIVAQFETIYDLVTINVLPQSSISQEVPTQGNTILTNKDDMEIINHAQAVFSSTPNGVTRHLTADEVTEHLSQGWNWDRLSHVGEGDYHAYLKQSH